MLLTSHLSRRGMRTTSLLWPSSSFSSSSASFHAKKMLCGTAKTESRPEHGSNPDPRIVERGAGPRHSSIVGRPTDIPPHSFFSSSAGGRGAGGGARRRWSCPLAIISRSRTVVCAKAGYTTDSSFLFSSSALPEAAAPQDEDETRVREKHDTVVEPFGEKKPSSSSMSRPWVCKECHKSFLSPATLQRHRLTRHAVQQAEARKREEEEEDQLVSEIHRTNVALRALLMELKDYKKVLKLALRLTQQPPTPQPQQQPSSSPQDREEVENWEFTRKLVSQEKEDHGSASTSPAGGGGGDDVSSGHPRSGRGEKEAKEAQHLASSSSSIRLGTGLRHWRGVGVVKGKVQRGHLWGHLQQHQAYLAASSTSSTSLPSSPPPLPQVWEVEVETHGYVEKSPGQMALYRQRIPVRYIVEKDTSEKQVNTDAPQKGATAQGDEDISSSSSSYGMATVIETLKEGDIVQVRGQYGLHASFDLISKKMIEHVMVEADVVTLLRRGGQSAEKNAEKEV